MTGLQTLGGRELNVKKGVWGYILTWWHLENMIFRFLTVSGLQEENQLKKEKWRHFKSRGRQEWQEKDVSFCKIWSKKKSCSITDGLRKSPTPQCPQEPIVRLSIKIMALDFDRRIRWSLLLSTFFKPDILEMIMNVNASPYMFER